MAKEESQTILSSILPSSDPKALLRLNALEWMRRKRWERLIARVASLEGRGCNFVDIHHSAELVQDARQTETVGKRLIYLCVAAEPGCLRQFH